MNRTYYEQRYCNECIAVHWVEVTRVQKEICHGEEFQPRASPTQYTRRLGRGIELVERINYPAIAERYNQMDHAFTQYLLERE